MKHTLVSVALATAIAVAIAFFLAGERTSDPDGLDERLPTEADGATSLVPIPRPLDEEPTRAPIASIAADPWSVDRGSDLHGLVTGPEGGPIAGARVTITSTGRLVSQFARRQGVDPKPIATLETDAQGRYSIALEAGLHYHLAFAAMSHGRAWRHDRQAGERVDISLAAAHEIRGFVRLDGEPVADVRLRLGLHEFLSGGDSLEIDTVRSNEDGSYRFRGLAPDAYTLRAFSTEAVPPPPAAIHVHEADVLHDVLLSPGRSIFGRVVDEATDEPIEGAVVEVIQDHDDRRSTTTDADGEYRIAAIDSELNRRGGAIMAFLVLAHTPSHGAEKKPIAIRPHDVADERVDFRLRRGVSVRGTLRFDGGATPPKGAEVTVLVYRRHGPAIGADSIRRRGRIDRSGSFVVDGVPAALPTLLAANGRYNAWKPQAGLEVRADGWRAPTLLLPPIEDDGFGVDVGEILLRRAASIQGRVVDETGSPLADVTLTVTEPVAWLPGTPETRRVQNIRPLHVATTDDLGRFRVIGLPAGTSDVRVSVPGGSGGRAAVAVELEPGEQRSDVEIVLERGQRLEGRVVTTAGEPVAGAIVMVRGEGAVETSGDGSFQVAGLGDGPFDVTAYLSDAAKRKDRHLLPVSATGIAAGTRDLALVLPEGILLKGRALDASGEPVAGANLSFPTDAHPAGIFATTSERGDFETVVPAGLTVDVRVDSVGGVVQPWTRERNPLITDYDPASGPLVVRLP